MVTLFFYSKFNAWMHLNLMFNYLHSSETCFGSYNSLYFKIIDKANFKFDLKIKGALHINWRKPNLNAQ